MRTKTTHIIIHRAEVDFEEYNFVVRRDGSLTNLVPFTDKAAHALSFNDCSVGVAVEGCFCSGIKARNNKPTPAQQASLRNLLTCLVWWYGPLVIKGHSELGLAGTRFPEKLLPPTSCPGDLYPLAEVKAWFNQK